MRRDYLTLGSLLLVLILADRSWSQVSIARLPPVDVPRFQYSERFRLVQQKDDDRDLVLFAADAVELRVPMKWHVREVSFGREIRLVIAPKLPKLKQQMPTDGMWLSCHVWSKPRPNTDIDAQLRRFLEMHSVDSYVGWKAKAVKWQRMQLAKCTAVGQEFSGTAGQKSVRGLHVAIRAPWGVCEIVMVSPKAGYDQRSVNFRNTLAALKLNQPQLSKAKPVKQTVAAARILGSWKAFRSRLRLGAKGRMDVITDRPIRLTRFDGKSRQPRRLQGRYVARGDIIYVTWSDGTKLNFRWRLRGDDLLLTDHEGQVSQLRRILE